MSKKKEPLPQAMVLVFEERLGHSTWQDVIKHRCRTLDGLVRRMKQGVKDGRYVAFRLITIHREEMGVVP